jgi:hypothetical protein
LEVAKLVNAKRIVKKLPSLLVNDSTTKKENWNSFMRYRHRFRQFKKKYPEKYSALTNRVIADLEEIEKAVYKGN